MRKDEKIPLTNEKFKDKFKSQFDLVNYAIKLADNMIKTGREGRVRTETNNPALQVLAEIAANKDQFDDIVEIISESIEVTERNQEHGLHKTSEKKKKRITV